MTKPTITSTWLDTFCDPTLTRLDHKRPKHRGLTMVIDKGTGLHQFNDFLHVAADYIDLIKLGFGTSVLYPADVLQEKINLAKQHGVRIYPGGTFFEVAYIQGKSALYLEQILQKGFTTVEISDGSIDLPREERSRVITEAKAAGLDVITECGKKASGSTVDLVDIQDTLIQDIKCGAQYMIVEGRESGTNVGIYDANGNVDPFFFRQLKEKLGDFIDMLIWEAPQKAQQVAFIHHFGANINIGNVSFEEVYALECLRRGLRSDTFGL